MTIAVTTTTQTAALHVQRHAQTIATTIAAVILVISAHCHNGEYGSKADWLLINCFSKNIKQPLRIKEGLEYSGPSFIQRIFQTA